MNTPSDNSEQEVRLQTPLDYPLAITFFSDRYAQQSKEEEATLSQLAERVTSDEFWASSKSTMAHIKLSRFSGERTVNNALRSNAAHVAISGIEVDYDAGLMSLDEAEERLRKANVAAFFYTSPSHDPLNAHHRWRALCPCSKKLPPAERAQLVARLNGVLGGVLAKESFTASQSFTFGFVLGKATPDIRLVDGRFIDQCEDLDASAIGKAEKALGEPMPAVDLSDDARRVNAGAAMLRTSAERLAATIHGENRNGALAREAFLMGGLVANNLLQPDDVLDALVGAAEYNGYAADYGGTNDVERIINLQLRHGAMHPVDPLPDLSHLLTLDDVPETFQELRVELIDKYRRILSSEAFALVWGEPSDPSFGLTLLDPDQCASFKPTPYVAKGLIAQGDITCVVGAPGVGKTPAASNIAYGVSLGIEVFGLRTREGPVLYLATENERDMRKRVTALRDWRGYSPNFHVVADCAGRFKEPAFLDKLKRLIAHRRPLLVVVDTLGAAMPGFEENSSEGMGEVLSICQDLRRIGPAVLLVHHDTKGGDGLPRGHSSLNGALDMNLTLKRGDNGVVVGTPSKNKNGPSNEPILAFTNKVVELGVDEDLDPITTVICEEESVAGLPKKKAKGEGSTLTSSAKAALAILEQVTMDGRKSTTKKEWRAACLASDKVSAAEKLSSRRDQFRRAIESLAQAGLYTIHGDDLEEVRLVVPPAMLDPEEPEGETLI